MSVARIPLDSVLLLFFFCTYHVLRFEHCLCVSVWVYYVIMITRQSIPFPYAPNSRRAHVLNTTHTHTRERAEIPTRNPLLYNTLRVIAREHYNTCSTKPADHPIVCERSLSREQRALMVCANTPPPPLRQTERVPQRAAAERANSPS